MGINFDGFHCQPPKDSEREPTHLGSSGPLHQNGTLYTTTKHQKLGTCKTVLKRNMETTWGPRGYYLRLRLPIYEQLVAKLLRTDKLQDRTINSLSP
jgi:hypothetical protein